MGSQELQTPEIDTRNWLSGPHPFGVIRQTDIFPPKNLPEWYIRPETAPGNFRYFNGLYESNSNQLPCAIALIGDVYRDEISPQNDRLIIHEFTVAEIEHFVDPEDKSHPKFSEVADLKIIMFPGKHQIDQSAIETQLGEAVSEGTVNNETLGYFIGRTFLFLTRLGIDQRHLRFRQRLGNEMTHYAADCWVAEIECSYGWMECVDISERSGYVLGALMEKSGVAFVAHEQFAEPREVVKLVIDPEMKKLGLAFEENEKKMVVESLLAMGEEEALGLKGALESKGEAGFLVRPVGRKVKIEDDMVKISKQEIREQERDFAPSVIESSFGFGRIIYCLFERSFYTRRGKGRKQNVFGFPPYVAPFDCAVLPLQIVDELVSAADLVCESLSTFGVKLSEKITGGNIGKRYARNDELGVPFAITVSSNADDAYATLRERDSRQKVKVEMGKVAFVVKELIDGSRTWSEVWSSFPHHE